MPTTTKRSIKVFYAWQSDLPAKFNRTAVKKCLRIASGELEEQLSTETQQAEVIIDEATRDCPGSPNIPASILEKIQAADVFVADVSIINSESGDKATPNPNVVFELGYAVANLGWERVIEKTIPAGTCLLIHRSPSPLCDNAISSLNKS